MILWTYGMLQSTRMFLSMVVPSTVQYMAPDRSPNHLHHVRVRLGLPVVSGPVLEPNMPLSPLRLSRLAPRDLGMFSCLADSDAFVPSIKMGMARRMRLQTLAISSAL